MRAEDLTVGMKVVPHSKSWMSDIVNFSQWMDTLGGQFFKEHGYVYVEDCSSTEVVGLGTNPNGISGTNYGFHAEDMEPYEDDMEDYRNTIFVKMLINGRLQWVIYRYGISPVHGETDRWIAKVERGIKFGAFKEYTLLPHHKSTTPSRILSELLNVVPR